MLDAASAVEPLQGGVAAAAGGWAGWRRIVGIVASRLTAGTIGRSWCWASPMASPRAPPGRSAGSIWVRPIAARQQGLLQQGGGHGMAAGMTLAEADLQRFHDFLLERLAVEIGRGVPPPAAIELDGALQLQSRSSGELGAAGAAARPAVRATSRPASGSPTPG